jgi:type IV secretory pathway TrbF-like protein
MDDHLLQLRQDSYHAASEYHSAMADWIAASRAQGSSESVLAAIQRYRAVAAAYNNALDAFIAYLRTLEPTPLVTEELDRVLKLQDILEREMELIL